MSPLADSTEVRNACPYRGLDSFTEERTDAVRFFGRDNELRALITHIRTARLTVLYAESGVGKSSLLRAGVTAQLRALATDDVEAGDEPMLVPILFSEWKNRPLDDFREAVAHQAAMIARPAVERLELDSVGMADVLRSAGALLRTTPVVILDQFEEHLGRVRAGRTSEAFIAELGASLEDATLSASFLIGVREDAFGKVDDLFRHRVAGPRTNLHLGYLTPDAARQAIELPIKHVYNAGRDETGRVTPGPGLVDEVLRQIRHDNDPLGLGRADRGADEAPLRPSDEIEAPLLQLVMERVWLYDVGGKKRTTLERTTFTDELGGAKQIVSDQLGQALKSMTVEETQIASDILRQLLTPSGTKLALTAHDIAANVEQDKTVVEEVLGRLDTSRVVRTVSSAPGDDADRFEIFHDKFTEPVLDMLTNQREARQQAKTAEAEAAQREAQLHARRELERAEEARRNAARARKMSVVAAVIATACILALIWAVIERGKAVDAHRRANSAATQAAQSGLQALAQTELATRPDISLLLLLAAHRSGALDVSARNIAALMQSTQGSATVAIVHGHSDAVESVAFDPTADVLASGSADGTVRLWRVTATGRAPLGAALPVGGAVFGVAFSSDGTRIAAATFDRVEVWSVATRRTIGQFAYSQGKLITSVAFSPDGRFLALGAADGAAILWEPSTGGHWRLAASSTHQVRSVAFSSDGQLLATASGPDVVLWRTSDRSRLPTTLTAPASNVVISAITFNPRARQLAATANARVLLWTLPSDLSRPGTILPAKTPPSSSSLLYSVAFSRDGRTVAAGGGSLAELVDPANATIRAVLTGPRGAVYGVAFSREGTTLAGGSADRTVRLWRLPANPLAGLIGQTHGPVYSVAVGPDNATVAAGGRFRRRRGFLELIRLSAGAAPLSGAVVKPVSKPVQAVAFDPVDDELAAGTADGRIQLWRTTTATVLRQWKASAYGAAFSLAFSSDGKQLVSGGADGRVRLWPVGPGGGQPRLLGRDFGAVYAVAFAGSTTVASGGTARTIHVWSLQPGTKPQTIAVDGAVFGLAFSLGGTHLAAASADGTVRLWTRTPRGYVRGHVLLGHLSLVRSVAFSSNGATLASSGSDGTVRLWDVTTGEPIGSPFTADGSSVESAAFSANGRYFVSGGKDHAVRQWQAVTLPSTFAALRQRVCAFLGGGLMKAEWDLYVPASIPFRPTCPAGSG